MKDDYDEWIHYPTREQTLKDVLEKVRKYLNELEGSHDWRGKHRITVDEGEFAIEVIEEFEKWLEKEIKKIDKIKTW